MKLCDDKFNVCIFYFVELIRLIRYHSSDIGWWFSWMYMVTVIRDAQIIDIMVKLIKYFDKKSDHN